MAWYNEIDPFCCAVLRARVADGRLPSGKVVERDVRSLQLEEILTGGQVHLFAGIGGFGYAARVAGLPDDFDLWTGGFPCQDISTAGKGAGLSGTRSGLFFEIVRLLRGVGWRPTWLLLENVLALRTRGYDRVAAELEALGYAVAPLVVGAWAVGAPHKRDRVWIVCRRLDNADRIRRDIESSRTTSAESHSDRTQNGLSGPSGGGQLADAELDAGRQQEPGREAEGRTAAGGAGEAVADALRRGCGTVGTETGRRPDVDECGAAVADAEQHGRGAGSGMSGHETGARGGRGESAGSSELAKSGRERRQRPGRGDAGPLAATTACAWPSRPGEPQYDWEPPRLLELALGGLIDGLPGRLVRLANRNALKACGNAIVPQVAATVMRAMLGTTSDPWSSLGTLNLEL